MIGSDRIEREGLLTTIRTRRKWYLGLYFLQIAAWLALLVASEVYNGDPTDFVGKRVLDAAVTMSFIAQGTLISTVLLIDVIFDGCRYLIKKGVEIMGLLFDNFENKFVVRGRKQGLEQAKDKLNTWVEENPEVKKLIEEGKVTMPLGVGQRREATIAVRRCATKRGGELMGLLFDNFREQVRRSRQKAEAEAEV